MEETSTVTLGKLRTPPTLNGEATRIMKRPKPLTTEKSKMTQQKSSGVTTRKPRSITQKSRKDSEIPADRGAYTPASSVEGSE
jgi:hypothetical protein